jgi:carbon-monoxide dehydrogenase large subunit
VSDAHAREHRIKARLAARKSGEITAMEVEDVGAVGAYGMPLRESAAIVTTTAVGTNAGPYVVNGAHDRAGHVTQAAFEAPQRVLRGNHDAVEVLGVVLQHKTV